MFFFKCSGDHQDLHSFPTRRSSDLCYVRALADEAGIERINTRWSDYVHVTDSGITEQIFLEHRGRAPTPDELARLQRRFVTLLEAAFTQPPGSFYSIAGAAHSPQRLHRQ